MKFTVPALAALILGCLGSHIDVKVYTRIVGGEEATAEEPNVVFLLNHDTKAQCTGTCINSHWVLTAANCNPGGTAKDFIVISGKDNSGQDRNHTITEWINHKEYNDSKYWDNNIALVKVEPIIEGIHEVVLPTTEDADYSDETGSAFGWGANCGFCGWSETLRKVDNLKIYSHEDCEKIYGGGPTNSTICAGNPDTLEGICDGDNGSPLMVRNVIVGITSWIRHPCASQPAVFTKVSHYKTWISTITSISK
ncbi:uncharacterized protein LOC110832031 [Zootermopsis nevadensis]|uniref:uncharacterized protein LOC110832031 n=1 Tax=Zootermopsis nevadensis TaxID=136037 RepID=UPI000B8E546C|nr:uncharacterized protein LOC110832031 [Zootermopsis nevadensis]